MNDRNRTRAVSMGKPLTMILLSSGCLMWRFVDQSGTTILGTIYLTVILGGVIISELLTLIRVPYLTEQCIELRKFGMISQTIKWEDVAQICIVHDLRWSMKVSGQPRIIITPRNCHLYDPKKWNGLQYLISFRNQVIWVEYTKKNLQIIGLHCGEIKDYAYGEIN